MKKINLIAAAFAGTMMLVPMTATAGNYNNSDSKCRTAQGKLCPPKLKEKVIPEYYQVPTKTQHIYYQKLFSSDNYWLILLYKWMRQIRRHLGTYSV